MVKQKVQICDRGTIIGPLNHPTKQDIAFIRRQATVLDGQQQNTKRAR